MPLDPASSAYSWFRISAVAVGLLTCLVLWRRPTARGALALTLLLNLGCWAACVAPLAHVYGLQEHTDRSFNVGIAAVAAAGNSPFEHVQARFANLEPFWGEFVAALALFRPENVVAAFQLLAPLSIVVVAWGCFVGLRMDHDADDVWERAWIVFAVFGLSSLSASQRTPIPPLWVANFLYKPNHICAFGAVAFAVGLLARRAAGWKLGLLLGLLSWLFLLYWAFLLPGLILGMFLLPRERRNWRGLALAVGLSMVIAAPYIRHLAQDYDPFGHAGSPRQIWNDSLGPRVLAPHLVTLDFGLLLPLGLAGAWVWRRRGTARDSVLLGVFAAAWLAWPAYKIGELVGVTPEADEHHYFLRLVMAVAAGTALAQLARHVEAWRRLAPGQGHAFVLAATLPLSFVAYWDPPSMDRFWRGDHKAISSRVRDYGRWVRENTPADAVFVAGKSACIWIPVFGGRRVLLAANSRPPADYELRKEAERTLILSHDPESIRAAARRVGVSYIAVDRAMIEEYGKAATDALAALPVYEQVFENAAVTILKINAAP